MRFARQLALLGFVLGLGGPILFYDTPAPMFPNGFGPVCPWCTFAAPSLANTLPAVDIGLRLGLVSAVVFGLAGYVVGYVITAARRVV